MRRTIRIHQFGDAIREILARKTRELEAGALDVCERGRRDAVRLTDDEDKVDTGLYRRRWKARRTSDGAELTNDTPYAGVIEWGRRPRQIRPPISALQKWARRKLGLSEKEALQAAFAIQRAIYERGLPPHHIMTKTRRIMIQNWREKLREIVRR